jgi:thioesterase domain-containing protein
MSHQRMTTAASAASLGIAVGIYLGIWIGKWHRQDKQRRQRSSHYQRNPHLSADGRAIEEHLQSTQIPARLLGIQVHSYKSPPASLSLSAPLDINKNVHGTSFAGSLYSIGALCSYYLSRQWCIEESIEADYVLVAKSGSIQYKRPVTSSMFVATSVIPSIDVLHGFKATLRERGKAYMEVGGRILQDDIIACEYSIEVCAYLPQR